MHYRLHLLFSVLQKLVLPPAVSYVLLSRIIPLRVLPHASWLSVISILSLPLLDTLNGWYTAYRAAKFGALPIPVVRGKWPGNLDVLVRLLKGVKTGYINETFKEMCEECASPTINLKVMWVDQIWTHDPNHMRHILVSGFNHFGKGDEQRQRMQGFLGKGIFATDDQLWKMHRSTLRPFLSKSQIHGGDFLDMWVTCSKSVSSVLEYASRNKVAIDIQDLAQRYTLDIALHAFLGIENAGMGDDLARSVRSAAAQQPSNARPNKPTGASALQLQTEEDIATSPSHIKAFAHAMDKAADVVIMRARRGVMWRVVELFSDHLAPLTRTMHTWVDAVIERESKRSGDADSGTFVAHLVKSTEDKTLIRDQLINMVFGARDTTAALITFVMYFLAIEREIYTTLCAEITQLCPSGTPLPSPEQLKKFVYLRAVLNETLRIFPSVPINTRYSTTESVFPPAVYNIDTKTVNCDDNASADSKSSFIPSPPSKYYATPLYMPPNTSVSLLKLLMQRRADLWGQDAEEFKPERWLGSSGSGGIEEQLERERKDDGMEEKRRAVEWFIPFSAGPRLCPGQNFAYIEASYFIISVLQAGFKFDLGKESQPMETRPPTEWRRQAGTLDSGGTRGRGLEQHNEDLARIEARETREPLEAETLERKGTGVFVSEKMGRKKKEECWPCAAFTLSSKGGLWMSVSTPEAEEGCGKSM